MLLVQDRPLLQRFRAGERPALARVFEHYSPRVARFLAGGFGVGSERRFDGLRDRFDLHDAVAETFRKAFEERARLAYDGLGPYEVYLKTIARNLVIDRLRRTAPESLGAAADQLAAAEALPGRASEEALSPEQRYQRAELSALLQRFLGGLPRDEARLVSLRFEEGLSQESLAEHMGKSRRWVRDTEVELRRRLLTHLRESGYLPSAAGAAATAPAMAIRPAGAAPAEKRMSTP
jgi:RNA polymerase sigma-70 factor (ECF subfamily)